MGRNRAIGAVSAAHPAADGYYAGDCLFANANDKEAVFLSYKNGSVSSYWRKATAFSTRKLTMMAILIAMQIILSRLTAISLGQWLRISFGFLPAAMAGLLMGPVAAVLVAGVADVLGVLLAGQALIVGLTVTTVFDGLMYGLILWDKKVSVSRAACALLPMAIITSMFANTFILAQVGYVAVSDGSEWPQFLQWFVSAVHGVGLTLPNFVSFTNRIIKAAVQYPVNVALLYSLGRIIMRLPASLRRV